MTVASGPHTRSPARAATAGVFLLGAAVAVAIGAYARAHDPALKPLFLFGFSGMLQMKTWFTTAALVLVVVQITTGLWLFGRVPLGPARPWTAPLHRWSGAIAFALTIPVALHCVWSLGLSTSSTRVLVHGLLGCAFYGAYAAKMLGLRVRQGPSWLLPVLGGLLFTIFVFLWLTSAAWFFSRSGVPLT